MLAGGIVVLAVGLIGLGAGAAYGSLAGEAVGGVVLAIGVVTSGVGAALKSNHA
ncbi:MAG: hypothetical protein KGI38_03700 [Thaumarchaeota archaeon]|nr:hypothetical protein [Nitrososphaerota archaeon]